MDLDRSGARKVTAAAVARLGDPPLLMLTTPLSWYHGASDKKKFDQKQTLRPQSRMYPGWYPCIRPSVCQVWCSASETAGARVLTSQGRPFVAFRVPQINVYTISSQKRAVSSAKRQGEGSLRRWNLIYEPIRTHNSSYTLMKSTRL